MANAFCDADPVVPAAVETIGECGDGILVFVEMLHEISGIVSSHYSIAIHLPGSPKAPYSPRRSGVLSLVKTWFQIWTG